MAYIGNSLQTAQPTYQIIDDISGSFNGVTTSFALLVGGLVPAPFPVSSQHCLISVGGVLQEPDPTGSAGYLLSGNNIVFSAAPSSGQSFFGTVLAGADYINVGGSFPDGTVANPSITFDSDLNTGIFRSGADSLSITTNGSTRATVDSSGRLLVNCTGNPSNKNTVTPTAVFDGSGVNGSIQINRHTSPGGGGSQLLLSGTRGSSVTSYTVVQSGDGLGTIDFMGADGDEFVTAAQIQSQVDGTPGDNDMPGRLLFSTTSDGASTTTERMRIDSSGRVLVGTSSNFVRGQIQVIDNGGGELTIGRNDTSVTDGNDLGHLFFASNDENGTGVLAASIEAFADDNHTAASAPTRLTISTTAVNATSTTERMRIRNQGVISTFNSDGDSLNLYNSASAGTSRGFIYGLHSATNNVSGGTISFIVRTNGNVVNTNNSYGAISDIKLKENIVDASSQWDDLKALQVRNYNFIEGQTHTQLGLVAQEVELVSPGLVSESPDRETIEIPVLDVDGNSVLDEEGNPKVEYKEQDSGTVTKSVNYSVLYMKAVKALQESMTRIETLETQNASQAATIAAFEARLTALEGGAS